MLLSDKTNLLRAKLSIILTVANFLTSHRKSEYSGVRGRAEREREREREQVNIMAINVENGSVLFSQNIYLFQMFN